MNFEMLSSQMCTLNECEWMRVECDVRDATRQPINELTNIKWIYQVVYCFHIHIQRLHLHWQNVQRLTKIQSIFKSFSRRSEMIWLIAINLIGSCMNDIVCVRRMQYDNE